MILVPDSGIYVIEGKTIPWNLFVLVQEIAKIHKRRHSNLARLIATFRLHSRQKDGLHMHFCAQEQ